MTDHARSPNSADEREISPASRALVPLRGQQERNSIETQSGRVTARNARYGAVTPRDRAGSKYRTSASPWTDDFKMDTATAKWWPSSQT